MASPSYSPPVNRTDRLYALVEELRAAAPRSRTAKQLSEHFEVSVRTVERDLLALQQAGVPVWATPGPGGGYAVDPAHTLPPVNFTPAEASAIAVALARPGATPFAEAARTALRKLVAAMSGSGVEGARKLVARVHLMEPDDDVSRVPAILEQAVVERRVVEIDYEDRTGSLSTGRAVEPHAFVGNGPLWYVVGWCRLRDDARSFRVDRIRAARLTDELAPERDVGVPSGIAHLVRTPTLE